MTQQHICLQCDEPVLPTDRRAPIEGAMHYECGVRMAAGGIRHQMGICTCCGGVLDPDPEGMTKRQAAQTALAYFLLSQRQKGEDGKEQK